MRIAPTFPVDTLRDSFSEAVVRGPVVLTSPTGSGKSTQIPRWCQQYGRVLVVEPRRVACVGLAAWVAELEGTSLGKLVGYAVRDDRKMDDKTQIVFATPGMVLRWMANEIPLPFEVVIIDEFHERSLETDLVLALVKARFAGIFVVMSAAMDAERAAAFLGADKLSADGRMYPVTCRYLAAGTLLPSIHRLAERVNTAVQTAKAATTGDILVFLPGKGEIARIESTLSGESSFEILKIHGSLHLNEQSRIFEAGNKRRIILATNVAETSITVPNIGVVIDSGLVKRTKYIKGRGYLTLLPIAMGSAVQRAGRAGRIREGVCYRLWSEAAELMPFTEPEIYRESLTDFVLAALACGADVRTLPFLDPPKPYAVDAALEDLAAVGAVDGMGAITERGRILFGFPLSPALGSLLVEAEKEGCLEDAVDLVSALAPGRPLFAGPRPEDPADDLRLFGCDAAAAISAVRFGKSRRHGLNSQALEEARAVRRRLSLAFSISKTSTDDNKVDRKRLARAALQSDKAGIYIVRRRKGKIFLADGCTEIQLSKDSAVEGEKCDAVFVFQSMAVSKGYGKDQIFATCAMPISFRQMAEVEVGEEIVTNAFLDNRIAKAEISLRFAGTVIATREEIPHGEAARQAIARLILERRIFPTLCPRVRELLRSIETARAVRFTAQEDLDLGPWGDNDIPTIEDWVLTRLEEVGLASGTDLALLTEADLTPPALPEETTQFLAERFPQTLRLGNTDFELEYNFQAREVTLVQVRGPANQRPSPAMLPAFRGFRVKLRQHSKVVPLR